MYIVIQVACFDAIFDCITNMTERLFNLHIVKLTPNYQTWKRRGFLIFILTLTSHFMFSYVFILQGFSWTEIYFGHFVQAAPILFGHLDFFRTFFNTDFYHHKRKLPSALLILKLGVVLQPFRILQPFRMVGAA